MVPASGEIEAAGLKPQLATAPAESGGSTIWSSPRLRYPEPVSGLVWKDH